MRLILALAFSGLGCAASAVEFSYVVTGGTRVYSLDNAVHAMIVDTTGEMVIADDGAITGEGTMTYIYMQKCQWAAPAPEDRYNCVIEGVQDGAFTISGEVLETVHRHDEDNILKDAIFEFAVSKASERPDYAPYRISLTLTPTALPEEKLVIYGLTGGGRERRNTGAATLGVLTSGLFNTPFEMVALNAESNTAVPGDPHRHYFSGTYNSGTYVLAEGELILSSIQRHWLPSETSPDVWTSTWGDGPPDRPFTEAEQAALDAYADGGTQTDTRHGMQLDIEDAISAVTGEEPNRDVDETAQDVVDILNALPGLKLK